MSFDKNATLSVDQVKKLYKSAKATEGSDTRTATLYASWRRIPGTGYITLNITAADLKGERDMSIALYQDGVPACDAITEVLTDDGYTGRLAGLDGGVYTLKVKIGRTELEKEITIAKNGNADFSYRFKPAENLDNALRDNEKPAAPLDPGEPAYAITGANTENGKLTISGKKASSGKTVTVTVAPDEGYKLSTLTVKDADGSVLTLNKLSDTTYTFTMPASGVTVSAAFVKLGVCPQDETCVYAKFTDADTKAWYHDGVHFCVENGYMNGVSATAFDPSGATSRGMIVTILWRMEGKPFVNYAMSFKDVPANEWYAEAVRWAQSTGVVLGYDDEAFGPNDPITREQMATILYRYAKHHGLDTANSNTLAGFTDAAKVSTWALDAMRWANAVGLLQGRTATTLVPGADITRTEAATMVQRYCEAFQKGPPSITNGRLRLQPPILL